MYIQEFPNGKYRFEIFINYDKKTWQQIKKSTGCYALCNLGFYDMGKFAAAKTRAEVEASTDCGLIVDGREIGKISYHEWGVVIDGSGALCRGTETGQRNYCIGCPPQYIGGAKYSTNKAVKADGCTHIGFKIDSTPVIALVSKDKPITNDTLNAKLLEAGCVDILRYDGSWSSQGDLGGGKSVTPSQTRIVQSYLLVFEREPGGDKETEGDKMAKKICLDPGHGLKEAYNQSPDGSYKEYEFTLDMGKRLREHLLRCGFEVMLTREDDSTPGLTARATMANNWGADLFVSLHSNADNTSVCDKEGWGPSSGLTVWIYDKGGERERAAKLLIEEMKAAGVKIFGQGVFTNRTGITVLKATNMPAILPEYLFHTNRTDVPLLKDSAYRDKLAESTAKAICSWAGVAYKAPESPEPEPPEEAKRMHRVFEVTQKVQRGAFENYENAEAFKEKLEGQGLTAVIISSDK